MKPLRLVLVLLSLTAVIIAPLWGAANPKQVIGADPAPRAATGGRNPATDMAATVSAITGIAISPLLATAAYGAYHYFRATPETRDDLPWFAKVNFWLPALLVVGLVAAKDTLGAILPPGWKQPLDVLEAVENKLSGLVAAGAVVPITMMTFMEHVPAARALADASAAVWPTGLAMLPMAAVDGATILQWLTVPFGVAIFVVVWMASHAINVLILMSPWGGVDAVLKLARLGVLSLVVSASALNPWLGAALSVVVIIIAYFVAGWAFRLMIFGTLYTWDVLTRGRRRFKVAPDDNAMFAGGQLDDVPVRTYGRLRKQADGSLKFVYRRWVVGPQREVVLPPASSLHVGCGMFVTDIETDTGAVLVLLPRHDDHEEELVRTYGFSGIQEAGLRRAWGWLREAVVGEPAPVRPLA